MPSSPIRKLAPLAEKAKARGVKVFHLNIGQPDLNTPQIALDTLKNIDRTLLEYSPSQGFKTLREKMVGYYNRFNIHVTADDIIITTGGSEAVNFAFMSCLDQGDEIIVPEPAYANYTAFALGAGVNVRPLISTIENGLTTMYEPYYEPDLGHYDALSELKLGELFAEEFIKIYERLKEE